MKELSDQHTKMPHRIIIHHSKDPVAIHKYMKRIIILDNYRGNKVVHTVYPSKILIKSSSPRTYHFVRLRCADAARKKTLRVNSDHIHHFDSPRRADSVTRRSLRANNYDVHRRSGLPQGRIETLHISHRTHLFMLNTSETATETAMETALCMSAGTIDCY